MAFIGLAVVAVVVVLAFVSNARGETQNDDAPNAVTNTYCPVQTDEPIDPEQSMVYEGQRVFFCCQMCKRKFERDPAAYLANLPQFAQAAAVTAEDSESHDESSSSTATATANPPEVADHAADHPHEHEAATSDSVTPSTDQGEHTHSAALPDEHGEEAAEHDHAAHEHRDETTGLSKLIAWLGNFHPPSVNFPIALLMSGLLAEVMLVITGREFFIAAARFCVWLGCLSTVPAVALGWFFAGFKWTDGDWLLTTHRWVGTAAGVWALVVLALCIVAYRSEEGGVRWRGRYRLALLVGAMLVGLNGFFGGAMIYGLDHYAW